MSTLIGNIVDSLSKHPEKVTIVGGIAERKRYGKAALDMLMGTTRFHLSSQVAQNASTLAFTADDVTNLLSLARLPFPSTWIEWNIADQFKPLGVEPEPDAPVRIGALVRTLPDGKVLITSVTGNGPEGPQVSPTSIVFDPDKPLEKELYASDREFLARCLIPNIVIMPATPDGALAVDDHGGVTLEAAFSVIDSCLIGGKEGQGWNDAYEKKHEDSRSTMTDIIDHASYILTPTWAGSFLGNIRPDLRKIVHRHLAERITETSGLTRFVIGALALINSNESVRKVIVRPTDKLPPPEGLPSKRRSPVYEFIEMVAPHPVLIRTLIESQTEEEHESGSKRGRHAVEAHFAHTRKIGSDDCDHNYERTGANRWTCLNCGKKRWHRRQHFRGDPALGVIEHKNRIVVSGEPSESTTHDDRQDP